MPSSITHASSRRQYERLHVCDPCALAKSGSRIPRQFFVVVSLCALLIAALLESVLKRVCPLVALFDHGAPRLFSHAVQSPAFRNIVFFASFPTLSNYMQDVCLRMH